MAREYAVPPFEDIPIPPEAYTFEGFLRWVESDGFPETGRIDFLAGEVEAEMSPEDLRTHGIVKTAIAKALQIVVSEQDRGEVFIDRARLHSRSAALSAEPDLVVVLWDSLESGRVRYVPAAKKGPDRFSALEGSPDLIVEVISDSSVGKDTLRLPRFYAQARIPELWLVDARGKELQFQILAFQGEQYVPMPRESDDWVRSPRLGCRFRLVRRRTRLSTWRYVLEHEG